MAMPSMRPPLDGVRKIVVLRPGAVGDFVFALPALHALHQTYPDAELVLAGKAWHRAFLQGRPGPVDHVVEVPPVPGVGAAPGTHDVSFVADVSVEEVAALACAATGERPQALPVWPHADTALAARRRAAE